MNSRTQFGLKWTESGGVPAAQAVMNLARGSSTYENSAVA